MKIKRPLLYIFALIFAALAYIVLFTHVAPREIILTPLWRSDITNVEKEATGSKNLLNFRLIEMTKDSSGESVKNVTGYFSGDGKILKRVPFSFMSSSSSKFYSVYERNNTKSVIYFADGNEAFTIPESGFVWIRDERIYNFRPGGSSFSAWDLVGKRILEHESVMPITAFASTKEGFAAGFADGTVAVFGKNGEIKEIFKPGGSEHAVIIGLSLSNDGRYIAAVTGQSRQRFVLARISETNTKIVFHEYIKDADAKERVVYFSRDDSTLYYNTKGCLRALNVASLKAREVARKPNLDVISVAECDECVFFLSKNDNEYTLYTVEKHPCALVGEFSFRANIAFLKAADGNLYIGKDNFIQAMKVERK